MGTRKKRDEVGIVFVFKFNKKAIGTIRFIPMLYGLTLTEVLLRQKSLLSTACVTGSWEAGRLVIDKNYRNGQHFFKRCLFLSLVALLERENAKILLSSCSYALSRLYGRFGFSTFARDVPLKNTGKTYSLIKGEIKTVLAALTPSPYY